MTSIEKKETSTSNIMTTSQAIAFLVQKGNQRGLSKRQLLEQLLKQRNKFETNSNDHRNKLIRKIESIDVSIDVLEKNIKETYEEINNINNNNNTKKIKIPGNLLMRLNRNKNKEIDTTLKTLNDYIMKMSKKVEQYNHQLGFINKEIEKIEKTVSEGRKRYTEAISRFKSPALPPRNNDHKVSRSSRKSVPMPPPRKPKLQGKPTQQKETRNIFYQQVRTESTRSTNSEFSTENPMYNGNNKLKGLRDQRRSDNEKNQQPSNRKHR